MLKNDTLLIAVPKMPAFSVKKPRKGGHFKHKFIHTMMNECHKWNLVNAYQKTQEWFYG